MPKNKKPAGGRPAKNFDPRYSAKASDSRKARWSNEDREVRAGGRGDTRAPRTDRGDFRSNRDDRRRETYGDADRGRVTSERAPHRDARGAGRDERQRRFNDSRGGGRPAERDDRGPRRFDRDDRPRRFEGRDNRAPSRDARGGRDGGFRDNRGAGRDERQRRFNDSRGGGRPAERDDRGPRRFDRDDRPRRFEGRDNRAPRRDDRGGRDERPAGRRFDERPERPARRPFDGEKKWQERRDEQGTPRTAKHEERIDVVHDKLEAEAVQATAVEGQSFGDLGLGENIVRVLNELGAASPFPIQSATIAPIIAGKDVLGRGRTGSGKTIAFGAPLVERILRSRAGQSRAFGRAPQALILAPTRELALQIDRTVQPIARSVGLFTTQIYGGVPQARQVGALKKGVDIIIGTPGRIEDLHKQGKLNLSEIQVAVLDEADHMCELGFLEPVQRILRLTKAGGQKLLFSATLDREVSALVEEFLKAPAVYEVAGEDQHSATIDHQVLVVDQRTKRGVIEQLADRDGRTIVFTRTRAFADQLVEQMEDSGLRAIALHGDLNQARRTRNIERFSAGKVNVLVATDVAARGIHVDNVDLVVQADAPDEYKTYMHRSGRTGRAGREGRVVTLIPHNRRRRMSDLLKRAEIDAPFREASPGDAVIQEIAR
ncbi:DEAD/DEAH box helicase [Microbacterium amylolyticum]|uniref:Superfamily II DNA/RNA helicase n=1 Tax=Microbacterium amylolyticum TaxID=936337 RepID=A0ABS4ZHD4_9MICO|nr:DEAD/DEAH box helicase [Microbacterium amylolyticum]MBP2436418.1 superfamily II DNA/RNA helicase [Microbacterium amylolyticum]